MFHGRGSFGRGHILGLPSRSRARAMHVPLHACILLGHLWTIGEEVLRASGYIERGQSLCAVMSCARKVGDVAEALMPQLAKGQTVDLLVWQPPQRRSLSCATKHTGAWTVSYHFSSVAHGARVHFAGQRERVPVGSHLTAKGRGKCLLRPRS